MSTHGWQGLTDGEGNLLDVGDSPPLATGPVRRVHRAGGRRAVRTPRWSPIGGQARPRAFEANALELDEATVSVLARARRRRSLLKALFDGPAWPWLQLATDVLMLAVAMLIALRGAAEVSLFSAPTPWVWAFPALALTVLSAGAGRARRRTISAVDAVLEVGGALSLAAMACITAAALFGSTTQDAQLLAQAWLHGLLYVGGGRTVLTLGRRWARARAGVARRTLIVGAGVVGQQVAHRLLARRDLGLAPVAMVHAGRPVDRSRLPVPIVGTPAGLVDAVERSRAEHVIVAFADVPDRELLPEIRRCQAQGIGVSFVPRLFESINDRLEVQPVGTMPLFELHPIDPKGWQFAVKYGVERCLAGLLLLVCAPLMLAVAALVKLTSPGPVLFRQRRVGCDGRAFDLLKFRSMQVAADVPAYVPAQGLAPGGVEGDDRRTRFGKLLRRTFIDELPQLINVVRGEMSLIGPRPERPEFVELFGRQVDRYGERHRARSGITGLAQVSGLRGQTSLAERVELDNHYIENWSLRLDLKIALQTLGVVLTNRGD